MQLGYVNFNEREFGVLHFHLVVTGLLACLLLAAFPMSLPSFVYSHGFSSSSFGWFVRSFVRLFVCVNCEVIGNCCWGLS